MSDNDSIYDQDEAELLLSLIKPFESAMSDPDVTEIMFNVPSEYWTKGKDGTVKVECPDITTKKMISINRSIAVYNKSKEQALSYFQMPGGERCTIIQPPACLNGYMGLIIRKFIEKSFTLQQIVEQGAFESVQNTSFNLLTDDEILERKDRRDFNRIEAVDAQLLMYLNHGQYKDFFEYAIKHKKNIVISGATGSGKTTFMRALIESVDRSERIITMEDVNELKLESFPNKLPLIFGRGEGRINPQQLLEACMRATPDRIFLAELRGYETWHYLMSLNTGHPGSITSVHSGTAYRAFQRIATLAMQSEDARSLGFEVIRNEVYTTIDIVVQMHNRKVTEIFFDPIYVANLKNQN